MCILEFVQKNTYDAWSPELMWRRNVETAQFVSGGNRVVVAFCDVMTMLRGRSLSRWSCELWEINCLSMLLKRVKMGRCDKAVAGRYFPMLRNSNEPRFPSSRPLLKTSTTFIDIYKRWTSTVESRHNAVISSDELYNDVFVKSQFCDLDNLSRFDSTEPISYRWKSSSPGICREHRQTLRVEKKTPGPNLA